MRTGMIVAFCMLLSASMVRAEKGTPAEQANRFLDLIKEAEVNKAYDELFTGTPLAQLKGEQLAALKRHTGMSLPVYGRITGYELVHNEQLSLSLVRLVYILKAENHVVTWEFYFYHPKYEWLCANVQFNDSFQGLQSFK